MKKRLTDILIRADSDDIAIKKLDRLLQRLQKLNVLISIKKLVNIQLSIPHDILAVIH